MTLTTPPAAAAPKRARPAPGWTVALSPCSHRSAGRQERRPPSSIASTRPVRAADTPGETWFIVGLDARGGAVQDETEGAVPTWSCCCTRQNGQTSLTFLPRDTFRGHLC